MKKSIVILLLLFGFKFIVVGQNAFYDSRRIAELFRITESDCQGSSTEKAACIQKQKTATKDLYGILVKYLPESLKNVTDLSKMNNYFKGNNFLKDYLPEINQQGGDFANQDNSIHKGLSSVGNLDVTSIADGLARFLIKRGKEELNIAFFQQMKIFLDSSVEAKTLFPATSKFLGNIESFRYSEFLQSLRESFYIDISNLIVNLNQLIDLPKYQNLLKALPEIRVAIRSVKIISELSQPDSSMHPANLIAHFAGLEEWGEMNINLKNSWQVLNKISESVMKSAYTINVKYDTTLLKQYVRVATVNPGGNITDTIKLTGDFYRLSAIPAGRDTIVKLVIQDSLVITPKNEIVKNDIAWIKFSDFNKDILQDSITLKIFLGLLYQKMEGINFLYEGNKSISVQHYMKDNSDNIFKIASLVENFLVLANDVDQSIQEIKAKKEGLTSADYYTYIEKSINIMDYGFKVANTIKEGIANDRYIIMARNANNLYKNIYQKNYNAAIMNGYIILEKVLTNSKQAMAEKEIFLNNLKSPNSEISKLTINRDLILKSTVNFKYFDSILARSFNQDKEINKRIRVVDKLLKYGNVMAGIVKSESPEEAEAAIEAAALPAGSSTIKKNSAINVSLNAYIGGYFARKVEQGKDMDGNNSKVGVTAPIGIAFSLGLGHFKNGSSLGALSLYGTLIDVGAIAGFRLNDDSTALEQKVVLNDIFTPGGYLVYGIGLPFKFLPYVPLSVGYGWQYGSKLYNKENGKINISSSSRWRSNWFVAVDIPLANFWTKGFKK